MTLQNTRSRLVLRESGMYKRCRGQGGLLLQILTRQSDDNPMPILSNTLARIA